MGVRLVGVWPGVGAGGEPSSQSSLSSLTSLSSPRIPSLSPLPLSTPTPHSPPHYTPLLYLLCSVHHQMGAVEASAAQLPAFDDDDDDNAAGISTAKDTTVLVAAVAMDAETARVSCP